MFEPSALIDNDVIKQLVSDVGLKNTKDFIRALEDEFVLRIGNINQALATNSLSSIASEAHAFKSAAITYGALPLGEALLKLELCAKSSDDDAFIMAPIAFSMALLTS